MSRTNLRPGLAIAGAVLALAAAGAATAGKQAPFPTITIEGVDDVCSGFTSTVDSSTGAVILTCQPIGTTSPGAPSGCTATISPSTLPSSGGTVSLNVNGCSPSTGVTYSWSRAGVGGWKAGASTSDSLPANNLTTNVTTTYQAQVCLTGTTACATTNPVTATVAGATAPPPDNGGVAWNGTCPGFNATHSRVMDWNNPSRIPVGMGPNDAVVVPFTTGSGSSTASGFISTAEYGTSPSARIGVLSPNPCDFGPQDSTRAASAGNSVAIRFYVSQSLTSAYPVLKPNTTYYFNIKNGTSPSCAASGSCDIAIDLGKPYGL